MKKLIFVLVLVISSGCASTSRMIEETDNGGKVMILGSKGIRVEEGVKDANIKMATKCPKGYIITKKGWMNAPSIIPNQAMTQEQFYDFKCK